MPAERALLGPPEDYIQPIAVEKPPAIEASWFKKLGHKVLDIATAPVALARRHKKATVIISSALALHGAITWEVGYQAHRGANILHSSADSMGHDAGIAAVKVATNKQSRDEIASSVAIGFSELSPDEQQRLITSFTDSMTHAHSKSLPDGSSTATTTILHQHKSSGMEAVIKPSIKQP